MTEKQILAAIKRKPGIIGPELGVKNSVLFALEAHGKIIRLGLRKTGKRGRPPIEWALSGTKVDGITKVNTSRHPRVEPSIKRAQALERVVKWNEWSKKYAYIQQQCQWGMMDKKDSDKCLREIPEIPSDNDYRIFEEQ